jgi:hypothetical protein
VALLTATVGAAAHPVAISRTISLHVAAVTVAARVPSVVITTPTLVASITATSGTDPWGNPYQAGVTVYGSSGSWAQLTDGLLQFMGTASQASPAYITTGNLAGLLELSSGTVSEDDSPALISLLSADANGGTSAINLTSAGEVQINSLVLNGQTISVPQTQPPPPGTAGSSWSETWGVSVETSINDIIARLQDAGLW